MLIPESIYISFGYYIINPIIGNNNWVANVRLYLLFNQDTIHTVYYAWAMQQVDAEELGEGAIYPIWRLREMQQLGVQALI